MGNPYYGELCVKSYILCVEKSDALIWFLICFCWRGMENRLNDASRPIQKHNNSLYTKEGLHPLPYGSQTEHANLQQCLWLCLGFHRIWGVELDVYTSRRFLYRFRCQCSQQLRLLSSLSHLTKHHLMTVPSMHASSHGDHTRSTVVHLYCILVMWWVHRFRLGFLVIPLFSCLLLTCLALSTCWCFAIWTTIANSEERKAVVRAWNRHE